MDPIRIGNFTSSDNHRLAKTEKVLATYVKEKRRERRLGIEIDLDSGTFNLVWGTAMEPYVFDKHIETAYTMCSNVTIPYKDGTFCGTPDFLSIDTVADLKCPATRTSFCDMAEMIEASGIYKMTEHDGVWRYEVEDNSKLDLFKECKPEYYWQLVSNSILTEKKYAELIVWMPYRDEIPHILVHIENIDDFQLQKDIQWLIYADPKRIPHIPNDSKYKSIYRLRFEVPEKDKTLIITNAKKAHSLLIAK